MKLKHVFLGGLLIITATAFSQKEQEPINPVKGSKSIEVNFKPFNSEKLISFDFLQTKYNVTDNAAIRLGFKLNSAKNLMDEDDNESKDIYVRTLEEKSLLLGIKPGIEYHFFKNRRVSPYLGFEVQYLRQTASSKYSHKYEGNYWDPNNFGSFDATITESTTIEGSWINEREIMVYMPNSWGGFSYQSTTITDYESSRAFKALGANMVMGANVYIVKNLYLGFELGLGYLHYNYDKIKIKEETIVEVNDYLNTQLEENTLPSLTTSELKFYYNSAIRLGFYF